MKGFKLALLALLLIGCLGGCGKPDPDVAVFVMAGPQGGLPLDISDKLQAALAAKVGEKPTVEVVVSPIFSMEKMIVEIASKHNGILIVPDEQFKILSKQAGFVSLDDVADPAAYPDQVLASQEPGKTDEKHLYGIAMADSKWFKEQGVDGTGLVAFVPENAPSIEMAKQVIARIAEK
ncbi:hypothetical protein B5M42_024865 [Paenibacillus athensensis]|uniref:Lipoprotein n=1 Tax=Paenibacillus athensensis TaxID=1967502 RepID=A0A4Y8PRT2_9BACL|nr:hypothetical protein [Paenibacillus athensensis]MCD1262017.1 hypothetical protein [Paenibacillus athensensis]